MSLGSSFVLYLLIGVGVAGALFVRGGQGGAIGVLRLIVAGIFWPLYVPVLLSARASDGTGFRVDAVGGSQSETDPLHQEITRVELELDRALKALDGWAEAALPWEAARFDELKQAWRLQAERIGEMSELLDVTSLEAAAEPGGRGSRRAETEGEPSFSSGAAGPSPSRGGANGNRTRQSETARRENIERLRELHQRMLDDLHGNLAWVRELVTLIHLAKYTGEPASRAEELVAQIAAAVEGLSRVSDWQSGRSEVATSAAD